MLEATLEAARDAILVVDLERHIRWFNRRYLDMFGFTAEELERVASERAIATIGAELDASDAAVATSREPLADPSIVRLDVQRFKDGRVIERFVAPLMIGARIAGRTAIFRDISAAVRAADALARPAARALGGGVGKGTDAVVGGGANADGLDEALRLVREQAVWER